MRPMLNAFVDCILYVREFHDKLAFRLHSRIYFKIISHINAKETIQTFSVAFIGFIEYMNQTKGQNEKIRFTIPFILQQYVMSFCSRVTFSLLSLKNSWVLLLHICCSVLLQAAKEWTSKKNLRFQLQFIYLLVLCDWSWFLLCFQQIFALHISRSFLFI